MSLHSLGLFLAYLVSLTVLATGCGGSKGTDAGPANSMDGGGGADGGTSPRDSDSGLSDGGLNDDGGAECSSSPDCDGATCMSGRCMGGDCPEGTTEPCGTGLGDCRGTQTCSGGIWGTCSGRTPSSVEICFNGIDDNCDGHLSEGCCTGGMVPCPTDAPTMCSSSCG